MLTSHRIQTPRDRSNGPGSSYGKHQRHISNDPHADTVTLGNLPLATTSKSTGLAAASTADIRRPWLCHPARRNGRIWSKSPREQVSFHPFLMTSSRVQDYSELLLYHTTPQSLAIRMILPARLRQRLRSVGSCVRHRYCCSVPARGQFVARLYSCLTAPWTTLGRYLLFVCDPGLLCIIAGLSVLSNQAIQ